MALRAELLLESDDRLGECPLWDGRALWWVDIHAPAIKRYDGKLEVFPMPEPVGSIAFRKDSGLLAALQSGLFIVQPGGAPRLLSKKENPDHRFNDGRCDRAGRFFWVGTLKDPEFTPTGSLFSFDGKTLGVKRQGIQVPNSVCWSPDGRTMYFADSPRHKIWAFDYDPDAGEISGERVFAAPHPGFPDGSCVDADGCLWNAEYGGARVVRYTPQGKVDRIVEVPAKNPTCCCFGGRALDTLHITTQGGAGLFMLEKAGKGLPESRFSG